tara:strand:+ start:1638 stop:1784 length:147 start_codon:yes stop_codon:yes gene_type:complete
MSIWRRVAYWRKKYNSTPNGWAVASLIGSEYESEQSKQSKSYRKEKSK